MHRALLTLAAVAAALPTAAAETPVVVSEAGTDRSLSLTVYNVGRALVRDARPVGLPAGLAALEFRDIAAQVLPETVAIAGPGVVVLEQNYEYDLLSPRTLLDKFLGREVTLVIDEPAGEGGRTERRRVTGRLLATNEGTVWRIGDDVVTDPPYRQLVFADVPGNLRERPTLVWLLDVARAASTRLEATYLTAGLTWKADYVLSLDAGGERAGLLGWVTLDNRSGADYPDARLQLVAGDVHLAPEPGTRVMYKDELRVAAAPQMVEESFAEYHLYTLPRPTTVRDRQQKQVTLLEADGVRVARHYRVETPQHWFRATVGPQKQDVRVALELANRGDNRLGLPLPGGVVRVYQDDARGDAQFVGEDRIGHTPKDEVVTLTIGNAFDVVAERRQTDFRSFDRTSESAFEVVLRNHKAEAVTVEVREQVGGDWEMLSSTHPYEKVSAFGVEFRVGVPADGEAKLAYRVRVRW